MKRHSKENNRVNKFRRDNYSRSPHSYRKSPYNHHNSFDEYDIFPDEYSTNYYSSPKFKPGEFTNIVLSGGSTKCICQLGALDYLIKKGFINESKLNYLVGASGGSVIAMLMAVGYTVDSIWHIVRNMDVSSILGNDFPSGILSMDKTYGISDGTFFMKILQSLVAYMLGGRINVSFKELYQLTGKRLVVIGSCLTTKQTIYFSESSSPDFDIVLAVRISVSIPIIFAPVVIDGMQYIDGALTNPYPFNYFKLAGIKEQIKNTIGITIVDSCSTVNESLFGYITSIYNLFMDIYFRFEPLYNSRTISIEADFGLASSLDFTISLETKYKLFHYGNERARNFTEKQNNH